MEIKGIIHNVNVKARTISILIHNHLKMFYFQTNLMKRFKKYLYKGNCITLVSEDSSDNRLGYSSYQVIYVSEIFIPTKMGPKMLYNKLQLNRSLVSFFDSIDNMMFLDLEMTMPSYQSTQGFEAEIIQAGYFIVNKEGEELERVNYYVRPSKTFHLNKRTRDFLHIDNKTMKDEGVSYFKFYNKFKQALNKYKPAIITFGKNDKLFLERSYSINKLPSLSFMSRFINISQLIKSYYELKNDPGLFNLYEEYSGESFDQAHDAFIDAKVTYEVYKFFIKDINKKNKK